MSPPVVHPTAVVDGGAELADGVEIGAYAVVGPDVRLGSGCRVGPHAVVSGHTEIGAGTMIHAHAVVGGPPQDLKYRGEPTRLFVGERNQIREGVTINTGTELGGGETRIGNDSFFMANSHVAHNAVVGNNSILVNSASLAGHVKLGDNCLISGMSGVHQFCRVGRFAVMSGGSMTSLDLPPFMIADGRNGLIRGINMVGLRRAGFKRDVIKVLKEVYKIFYKSEFIGTRALELIEERYGDIAEAMEFVDFVRTSKRGVNQVKGLGRRG